MFFDIMVLFLEIIVFAANSNLGLHVFLCRLSWMWTLTLQEHLQDIG